MGGKAVCIGDAKVCEIRCSAPQVARWQCETLPLNNTV